MAALQSIDLTPDQCKEIINIHQLFEVYNERVSSAEHFKGSMTWKSVKGNDYLYKKIQGKSTCLGVRSPETEVIYAQFCEGKPRAIKRVHDIFEQMKVAARYAKAARVNRFPKLAATIIRKIQKAGLSNHIAIVGTHAMYGYESMASKYVVSSLMETADLDLLWDKRMLLRMACASDHMHGLMSIIQSADRSFEKTRSPYRAINKTGFMVDLVSAEHDMKGALPSSIGASQSDLKAAPIGSLTWLINAPKVDTMVIDTMGLPLSIRVPDPRCFAVHKAWISMQPSRDSHKIERDLQQSKVVADMVHCDMAGFAFRDDELAMFPFHVRTDAKDALNMDDDWIPR